MLRIIILILLIYIVYNAYKFWQKLNAAVGRSFSGNANGKIDDVMVKDPFCEVYFPKREGIHLRKDGNDLYFCSSECRDRFLESGRKE